MDGYSERDTDLGHRMMYPCLNMIHREVLDIHRDLLVDHLEPWSTARELRCEGVLQDVHFQHLARLEPEGIRMVNGLLLAILWRKGSLGYVPLVSALHRTGQGGLAYTLMQTERDVRSFFARAGYDNGHEFNVPSTSADISPSPSPSQQGELKRSSVSKRVSMVIPYTKPNHENVETQTDTSQTSTHELQAMQSHPCLADHVNAKVQTELSQTSEERLKALESHPCLANHVNAKIQTEISQTSEERLKAMESHPCLANHVNATIQTEPSQMSVTNLSGARNATVQTDSDSVSEAFLQPTTPSPPRTGAIEEDQGIPGKKNASVQFYRENS